jgi:hypothetical protein
MRLVGIHSQFERRGKVKDFLAHRESREDPEIVSTEA